MATVYLGFGTNIGDRRAHYQDAQKALDETPEIELLRSSSLREYPPMGPPQADYLNGAIEIQTSLEPSELLGEIHRIEKSLGRTRGIHWGPRTVDLDILFWEHMIVDTDDLKIPHPGACQRIFVIEAMVELRPDLVDPVTGRNLTDILNELR